MILVVGMPRSRTSLLIQTVRHLGIAVIGDFTAKEDNVRGNGECQFTSSGIDTTQFPPSVAMKIMLDAFLFRSKIGRNDQIIFALRPPEAVIWSRQETGHAQFSESEMRRNYWRLTKQFLLWKEQNNNPTLMVPTDEMILNPGLWVSNIAIFLGVSTTDGAIRNVTTELTTIRPVENQMEDDAQAVYREAMCFVTT